MVRVYMVDARTGELLKKKKPRKAAVLSNKETSTAVGWKFAHGEWVADRAELEQCECVVVRPLPVDD